MGGLGRRASDEQDVRTARPIVAPKRAQLREHEQAGAAEDREVRSGKFGQDF